MTNLRQQVNKNLWITLAFAFLILYILVSYIVYGYTMNNMIDQHKTKAELFAEVVKMKPSHEELRKAFNKLDKQKNDVTFTFYSTDGNIVYSNVTENETSLQLDRDDHNGWIQKQGTNSERFIYSIESNDIKLGYIEFQLQTSLLKSEHKGFWILLLGIFIIMILVIIYILSRLSGKMLNPVEDAIFAVQDLAKGNFKVRVPEYPYNSMNDLNYSVNKLAINLTNMLSSYEVQQDRLTTLIENMGSSLILIDSKGHITLVNKAFKETFQLEDKECLNVLYHEILPHEEMIQLIKEIFFTEEKRRKQLLLTINIERRHFDVYGAPILSSDHSLKGIVLVFHDITELKKLEQMRKDFVANVSHELKTPVTSLKGFAETLLEGAKDDPETCEKFLSIIWQESDRLQTLIQDLLELSKIEQEGFKLDWQKVDLQVILEDVELLLRNKAKEKEIQLTYKIDGNTTVIGDMTRIKQIFINVINNGLNYTSVGGRIHVALKEQENVIEFTVQDNGIGINNEEIPRIFERFYRVDKARSRNSGGTGLGLAIVKHLVDALKGTIEVKSSIGKGTVFTINFSKNPLQ